MIDLSITIPSLIGSSLSLIAAAFVIICYWILPPQQHFRHTLILNLASADFLNALNTTISSIYALAENTIPPGIGCAFNGVVGQLTSQAIDFSILFIAIATLVTMRRPKYMPTTSRSKRLLMTCAVWTVPIITSIIGLALDAYEPNENSCSLPTTRLDIRYSLENAWRLAIIFTTIVLYTYLFIYLHNHFSALRQVCDPNASRKSINVRHWCEEMEDEEQAPKRTVHVFEQFEICEEPRRSPNWEDRKTEDNMSRRGSETTLPISTSDHDDLDLLPHAVSPSGYSDQPINLPPPTPKSPAPVLTRDPLAIIRRPSQINPADLPITITTISSTPIPSKKPTLSEIDTQESFVKRSLFINAYPIAYILLWLPGVFNMLVAINGSSSPILNVLQTGTHFVGLANALVFAYNERIWERWCARSRGVEKEEVYEDAVDSNDEARRIIGGGEVFISWPTH